MPDNSRSTMPTNWSGRHAQRASAPQSGLFPPPARSCDRPPTRGGELSAVSAYPVTVRLEQLDPAPEGQVETVKARLVAGCDGARSAVRGSLGRALLGDSANQAWGVMDVLAIS